jgi:hypothetical protein
LSLIKLVRLDGNSPHLQIFSNIDLFKSPGLAETWI